MLVGAGQAAIAPVGRMLTEPLALHRVAGPVSFEATLSLVEALLQEHVATQPHLGIVVPRRNWTLWLDERWCRLYCVKWPDLITDPKQLDNMLQAEFERRFDLDAQQWHFVAPGAWPNRSFLCAAVLKQHLQAIDALEAKFRIKISEILPFPVAEIKVALSAWPKAPFLFLGSAASQQPVFLCHRGRAVDFALLPAGTNAAELATSLFSKRTDLRPRWYVEVQSKRERSLLTLLGRDVPALKRHEIHDDTSGLSPEPASQTASLAMMAAGSREP
jgi:hypothetical protein